MRKKRVSKVIITTTGMVLSFAMLVGNTFALSLVKDEADPFTFRIIPSLTTYSVKFYGTDNTTLLKSIDVVTGHTIDDVPSNPTLSNYVFDGWTTNINNSSDDTYFDEFDLSDGVFSDLNLYPRMASYGYDDGSVHSLAGNTVTDKTIGNTSLKVGTYYNGSSVLFDSSNVTLQYSGTYSIVCGSASSSWARASASSLDNWNIGRKITFTPQSCWSSSDYRFAVYSYSTDKDSVWTSLSGTSSFTGYIPYQHTKYIFCAMDKDQSDNNWDNKRHQSQDVTNISNATFTVHSNAPEDNWNFDNSGNTVRQFTVKNVPSWTFNDGYYPTVWVRGGGESGRAFTISEDSYSSGKQDLSIMLNAKYTNYKLYRRKGTTGSSGSTTYGECQNELGNVGFETNTYDYNADHEGGWR